MGYLLPVLLVLVVVVLFFTVFSADDKEEPGDCRTVCGGDVLVG